MAAEVLKVAKYEDENIVSYLIPCESPILEGEWRSIIGLPDDIPLNDQVAWESNYVEARLLMFNAYNLHQRAMKAEHPNLLYCDEISEEKILSTIDKEIELVQRYLRNDPAERMTGLDTCLFHPTDRNCRMCILTMQVKPGDGWHNKSDIAFKMAGVDVKFGKYTACQEGRIAYYEYIPVEEDYGL